MPLSCRPSLDVTDLMPSSLAGHLVTLAGFGRVRPVCGVYLDGERIAVLEAPPTHASSARGFELLARQLADRADVVWLDRTAAAAWAWADRETPPETLLEYQRLTPLKFGLLERTAVLQALDTPPFAGDREEVESLRALYGYSGGDPLGFGDWLPAFLGEQDGAFCTRHAALLREYREAASAAPTGFAAQRAFEGLYEAWLQRLDCAWDSAKPQVPWMDELPLVTA